MDGRTDRMACERGRRMNNRRRSSRLGRGDCGAPRCQLGRLLAPPPPRLMVPPRNSCCSGRSSVAPATTQDTRRRRRHFSDAERFSLPGGWTLSTGGVLVGAALVIGCMCGGATASEERVTGAPSGSGGGAGGREVTSGHVESPHHQRQRVLLGYLAGTAINRHKTITLPFRIPSPPRWQQLLIAANLTGRGGWGGGEGGGTGHSTPAAFATLTRRGGGGTDHVRRRNFSADLTFLTDTPNLNIAADCNFAGKLLSAQSMSLDRIAKCLQRQGLVSLPKNLQGHLISGAMRYAVETVNKDTRILPNHKLDFIFTDTRGVTRLSVRATMEQWNKGVMAFIGPEDSCETEAMIAAAQNLPMISFKCSDYAVSNKNKYSTFARTVPAESQVSKAAVALLKHYNWRKFSIIYGMNTVNTHLLKAIAELSDIEDLKIQNISGFMEPYMTLISKERERIRAIIADTYQKTRVYVFFGSVAALQDVLYTMDDLDLMKNGEYVVIYLEPSFTYLDVDDAMMNYFYRSTLYTVEEFHQFPFVNRIVGLSRSLLAIIPSPVSLNSPEWRSFWRMVTQYNAQPPFNFFNTANIDRMLKVELLSTNRYASYLYDAVMLYATALHEVIHENGSLTNGTAIISKIFNRRYLSIQGFEMQIDEKGDAEGNFTLLTRQRLPESRFNLTYGLVPSGYFIEKNDTLPGVLFKSNLEVDWPGGKPPDDEPECGFSGEYCVEQPSYGVEIVCGAVGVVLMILSVVSFIYYRNRKYEQELAGLIWKINPKEIQFHPCTGYDMLADSKTTLCSQDSTEFAAWPVDPHGLGVYRGSLVAIKEIRYAKRTKEISRATKIEMKKMRGLHHDNINRFLGIIVQSNFICVVREYCAKGSLFDVLLNENIRLDSLFIASFIDDLIKGMVYLHDSELRVHGNLKSTNCCVTSRWSLQVSDFGLSELREGQTFGGSNEGKYFGMLWTAPEHLLENPDQPVKGSQKGDVYSFAVILHEIFSRNGPFGIYYDDTSDPEEIVNSVMNSNGYCRPTLHNVEADKYILDCMVSCWDERPEARPDFHQIRTRLKPLFKGILKRNIMDHMMAMMEKYQTHLEELVEERTEELKEEKKRTEILLHRMLPKVVAAQLMSGKDVIPETFDSVTIYFSDIVGFTALSAESTPVEVVAFLNALYTLFDRIIRQYDVYKVETIGDAYMVVSGLPVRNGDQHAGEIATMALRLLEGLKTFKIPHRPDKPCLLRIGVHTGPCAAGVVGKTMPRYCLFGDTVNTASRMESNGMPLKIHCSESTKLALEKLGDYYLEERGLIPIKGKGEQRTYWLLGKKQFLSEPEARHAKMSREEPLFPSGAPAKVAAGQKNRFRGSAQALFKPDIRFKMKRNSVQNLHLKHMRSVPSSGIRLTESDVETETCKLPPIVVENQRETLTTDDVDGQSSEIDETFRKRSNSFPERLNDFLEIHDKCRLPNDDSKHHYDVRSARSTGPRSLTCSSQNSSIVLNDESDSMRRPSLCFEVGRSQFVMSQSKNELIRLLSSKFQKEMPKNYSISADNFSRPNGLDQTKKNDVLVDIDSDSLLLPPPSRFRVSSSDSKAARVSGSQLSGESNSDSLFSPNLDDVLRHKRKSGTVQSYSSLQKNSSSAAPRVLRLSALQVPFLKKLFSTGSSGSYVSVARDLPPLQ